MSGRDLRGRQEELGRLKGLVDSVSRIGGGTLALVQGEPGIGKSSILDAVIAYGRERGFLISRGTVDELDQIAPLSSLTACLLHGEQPLLTADAFSRLSCRHDQRMWLMERLAGIIEAKALNVPILIALDDVQWADPFSRFALRVLPARLRTSPVLWLLAGRMEHGGPAGEIAAAVANDIPVELVRLGPLSGTAIDELACDVLGRAADVHVRKLLDGAAGNPFLAVEMLAGLAAGVPSPVSGEPGEQVTPTRLILGVRGRLSSLPASTLLFLRVGAVLGSRFVFADACALLGQSPVALLGDLEAAIRGGLLDDDGEHLHFRHDLLRQAVYADISPSARKALHREAAVHLATVGRGAVDAAPHLFIGALPGDRQAVDLLRRAAADVLAVMPALAADFVTRALDLVPEAGPLRFEVGEQAIVYLTRAGRNREAVQVGDRLLAQRPAAEVAGRLQAALGGPLWSMRLTDELEHRAEAALEAGGTAPRVTARLAALHALALSRGEDLDAARAAGETALERASTIDDREARVTALLALGEIELNAGRCRASLGHFTTLRLLDPAFTVEEIVARQHLDDYGTSDRMLAEARRDSERDGGPLRPAMLLWAQANHHLGLGRLDDAEADFLTLERLEEDLREPVHQVNSRVTRCWIAHLRGDGKAAHECLASARAALAARPDPGNRAAVRFIEAITADLEGDTAEAVHLIERARADGPTTRWRLLRTWIAPAVRLAVRGGDHALAAELAAQSAAYAERNPDVATAAGIAAQAAGLAHADLDQLERAVTLLRCGPRPLIHADAIADLGSALLARGRRDEAVTALRAAGGTFTRLRAYGQAARVQDHLDSAGARGRPRSARPARPARGWRALTPTEEKVARIIAAGHTNRSAAAELFISPHTVNTHVTSIFRKLSVTSRVQLARAVMAETEA
ncbi:DNA-binding CsgD family transcriptional regulator/tetratricopeptide (TPR) repeat protein [Streptosporangium lutulentum]|uniref:DNA-binding CsgD family transcriptional regulator/tetratricopeptide (TPR) repeat protein n=1 Tax=Streptosporangium lutulentum TaxID=1461250 RepID=A0ABT9Q6W9_9ACTN|nr:AAA family ATPase [Streptosporangium lutulentum]MDP9842483.1 DNA-binding CsgD family transcriptional regulator/tetratricopeptide (TPR) repeat protein [Streptosporangium lutulentum]